MVVNGEVIEMEELSLLMDRMCLCDDAEVSLSIERSYLVSSANTSSS